MGKSEDRALRGEARFGYKWPRTASAPHSRVCRHRYTDPSTPPTAVRKQLRLGSGSSPAHFLPSPARPQSEEGRRWRGWLPLGSFSRRGIIRSSPGLYRSFESRLSLRLFYASPFFYDRPLHRVHHHFCLPLPIHFPPLSRQIPCPEPFENIFWSKPSRDRVEHCIPALNIFRAAHGWRAQQLQDLRR